MVRCSSLVLALVLAGCGAPSTDAEASRDPAPEDVVPEPTRPGVDVIRAPEAAAYWPEHGFVELVPPVRLPTTHDHRDRTQVWLKLPEEGVIETRWLDEQERHTISMPAGTRLDRVESLATDGERARWTVVDVRGAALTEREPTVHVCRPISGEPFAPLVGYAWPRGRPALQRHATGLLLEMLEDKPVPIRQPPMDEAALARFERMNACGRCHRPDLPSHPRDRGNLPHRPTDADGCYVPLSVLREQVPISEARPEDLNADDPYVRLRCPDGSELLRRASPECASGAVPVAERDVERGLAEGDRYTERVCEARRVLHAHLDEAGREAFAGAFRACGIR
ncbi:MAG TPA: hypothetical protein RMH99_13060 [Sandaracinaceae bacterium LLY-WYZ-13_1]|nr:hypothetical protein [Sandaracinaceae bacterium LLY-WYZ-13_1]